MEATTDARKPVNCGILWQLLGGREEDTFVNYKRGVYHPLLHTQRRSLLCNLRERYVRRFCQVGKDADGNDDTHQAIRLMGGDAINELTLALHNPSRAPLDDFFASIQFVIDGHVADAYGGPDIHGSLRTAAALRGRESMQVGDTTFVPLPTATTHHGDLCPILALPNSDVRVVLQRTGQLDGAVVLYGNKYLFSSLDRRRLETDEHDILTTQTSHWHHTIAAGTSLVPLRGGGLCTAIALRGVKLRRIRMVVQDDDIFLDVSRDVVRFEMAQRMKVSVSDDACVLFLTDAENPCDLGLNVSHLPNARLEVETDGDGGVLHVTAIRRNACRFGGGHAGMAF